METKFTKGPWCVRKDENGNTVVATTPEPSDILPGATQSWHLAIVMGTPGRRDKQANAHVMAASPLLYEVAAVLDKWSRTANPMRLMQELDPIIEQCRNALRAARGEE